MIGVLPVLLTACSSGAVLYEKTDTHLILPCYEDENSCMKKITDRCTNALSGTVVGKEVRKEDVSVAYVLCRPPQNATEGDANAPG